MASPRSHRRVRGSHSGPVAGTPVPPGALAVWLAVVIVFLLGGGGNRAPLTEMLAEVGVAAVTAAIVLVPRLQRGLHRPGRAVWIIAALVLIVPFVQIIPLPPALWHALPGRELEQASLALIGRQDAWMPISVAPANTLGSLLAMACVSLVMLLVAALAPRDRTRLCGVIAAVGLASILLGGLQLAQPDSGAWSLYRAHDKGYLVGFQAARNAETDILKAAVLAFAVYVASRLRKSRNPGLLWVLTALGLFVGLLGVALTGSRTGLLLLGITVPAVIVVLWPALRRTNLPLPRIIAAIVVVLALAALALGFSDGGRKVLLRFALHDLSRITIWQDTLTAIGNVWPVGGGFGTFQELFNSVEALETVDPAVAGRAHNDWLEVTLEAGLAGLAALLAIAGVLTHMLRRALAAVRNGAWGSDARSHLVFAIATLLVAALHAVDDFPLRNLAQAMLCAIAVGMIAPPRSSPEQSTGTEQGTGA